MAKDSKPRKSKSEKFYTRAKSERLLTMGADPTATFVDAKGATQSRYTMHPNYHVRCLAWKKMGKPLPENGSERDKFLASIHAKLPVAPVEEMLPEEAVAVIFPDETPPTVGDEVIV